MSGVVAVDPRTPDAAVIGEAVRLLKADGVIAFPTETFYGLGAGALRPAAVRRVIEVKGRPEGKPLLVLVDSIAMVERVASDIPAPARALMARHWPGALTLVLAAAPAVPAAVTAGSGTVGVRLSPHPVARALVSGLGEPITAPSANPSGAPPPTTAHAVVRYFDARVGLVLDGGPTAGGAASTVLDVTVDPPRVLRQGAVRV